MNNVVPLKPNPSLSLGDVVKFKFAGPYSEGTVSQVHANGTVDIFRPYTATADFACAGREKGSSRLICYVGIEEVRDIEPANLILVRKNSTPIR